MRTNAGSHVEPAWVQFMFDFGNPNADLAERVIPDVERRTGVKFEYVPVLLGGIYKLTGNSSPAEYLRGIENEPEFQELETQRFIRRHNIAKFRKNPCVPVNTLQLMRGAVGAQFEAVFEPYCHAAYYAGRSPGRYDPLNGSRSPRGATRHAGPAFPDFALLIRAALVREMDE